VGPAEFEKRLNLLMRRHLQVVPHLLLRAGCTEGDPGPLPQMAGFNPIGPGRFCAIADTWQLIIRREGTRIAFVIPDFPPGSFSGDAAQLADDETKHGDVAKRGVIKGTSSGPSTLVRFPLISAPQASTSTCGRPCRIEHMCVSCTQPSQRLSSAPFYAPYLQGPVSGVIQPFGIS
jgi:hypothetical protein